jgi:hypothetical protein
MGWVVNATPRTLYLRERPGTHCIGGCVGTRAGRDGAENLAPTGIRSPDRPARSESLYRLSYPGPPLQLSMFNFLGDSIAIISISPQAFQKL